MDVEIHNCDTSFLENSDNGPVTFTRSSQVADTRLLNKVQILIKSSTPKGMFDRTKQGFYTRIPPSAGHSGTTNSGSPIKFYDVQVTIRTSISMALHLDLIQCDRRLKMLKFWFSCLISHGRIQFFPNALVVNFV
ncbi:hypothetical protein POM88_053235 [Heracleum sosnowskyi]|uniref:Uncharacterized protein n=1 Tax=Heracleum sosnowskyi TaxID=360622 RepID=A0AAD8GQ54_9APIA|nr:hypothetical protein POM88_053235 [Heracleum sosnowskyi]